MNKLELICMMATKIFVKKLESLRHDDAAIQESVRLANEIYYHRESDPYNREICFQQIAKDALDKIK